MSIPPPPRALVAQVVNQAVAARNAAAAGITAAINGPVVSVDIVSEPPLRLDMSLLRHSFRHCGTGASAEKNSLLYASVDDATIVAEALEVGLQVTKLLGKAKGKWSAVFGETLTVASGRTYLVDNSGLNANGAPNHFFVTGGTGVWANVSQAEFVAARDVRLVEEAIANRRGGGDTYDYLGSGKLYEKSQENGGQGNRVVVAVAAARVSIAAVSGDANLIAVSGRQDIVDLIRNNN
ncbi:hypothetical protein ACIRQQ_03085 [Streptomyces fuscichromogenes]|uniref:hypothetical protein n=1 Tax=Streptomyces fuscichromogenes TaxID=1324013 RepID=UPI00381B8759